MNIGEFIIRTAILLIIFVVPGFSLYFVYKKTKKAMDFTQSEILKGIVIEKRINIKRVYNTNVYELLYFIEVEDDAGHVFDINISSKEYFKIVNGSNIKLEFYKKKLINIKFESRGKGYEIH